MKFLEIYKTDANEATVSLIERDDSNQTAWEEFGESTMEESENQPKVREYYFKSHTTEVIAQLLDIVSNINSEEIESIFNINMSRVAQRYINSEQHMIQKLPTTSHPSPCDIFTSLEYTENRFTFFISKIDVAMFFDRTEGQIKSGLPHSTQGSRTKNWKTATIIILMDDTGNYEIEKVTITDTSSKIADYWAVNFLEATEITDDVKNTKDVYTLIKKIIGKNGGRNKSKEVIADNTHYLNQLNGYMINNNSFTLENALNSVFGDYDSLSKEFPPQNIREEITRQFSEKNFDTSFEIVHNEIKSQLDINYKISEKITLKVKHMDNIKDTITSTLSSTGDPIIVIKVDNVDNKVYQSFLNRESNI